MATKKRGSVKRRARRFWKKNKKTLQGAGILVFALLLVAALTIPALRGTNPGNTFGVDVSEHNGKIAWDDVSENGIAFAVIRAGVRSYGKGEIREDARFKRNMRSAWFHHVERGVYFYSQAVSVEEAREEAEATLKFVGGANLSLPVFIDVEDTGTGGKGRADHLSVQERTDIVLAFADVIREKGYTPGLYANRWFLTNQLDTAAIREKGIAIWLAEYTSKGRPSYKGSYDYWQYTEKGSLPGISGPVDLNRTSAATDALYTEQKTES